jgi:hypothetical protein
VPIMFFVPHTPWCMANRVHPTAWNWHSNLTEFYPLIKTARISNALTLELLLLFCVYGISVPAFWNYIREN